MDKVAELFRLAAVYGQALNLAEASVSTRVLAGGGRLAQIRSGKDIGVRRLAVALQWFSDNWPDHTPWPQDVQRPSPIVCEAGSSFDVNGLLAYLAQRPHYDRSEHAWDLGISVEMLAAILDGEEAPPEVRAKLEARMAQHGSTPRDARATGAIL